MEKLKRYTVLDDIHGYQIGSIDGVEVVLASDLAPLLALVQEVVAAYPDPEPGSVMARLGEMVKGA